MIENIPPYITVIFELTTIATLLLFVWTVKNSNCEKTQKKVTPIFILLTVWLLVQAVLSINNLYNSDTISFPPKIMLIGILPTLLAIILVFVTRKGRAFIDRLPLRNLTLINIVRIPVEVVLFWLFQNQAIPEVMTFEGRNFDIIAGITALIMVYLNFAKIKLNRIIVFIWNFVCLGLLVNIIFYAVFSTPSPIQKFAFEQPNIAILNFPFSWLPTFIVPIVLFGHLACIRQLIKNENVQL